MSSKPALAVRGDEKSVNSTAGGASVDFDVVDLRLMPATGADAIQQIHAHLAAHPAVRDRDALLRDLLKRHALGSSCLDENVALAHARTGAVTQAVLAVGRSEQPIAFDEEHQAVRLVIVFATPPQAVQEYLRYAVTLARKLRQPATRAGLLAAETVDEFRAIWTAAG